MGKLLEAAKIKGAWPKASRRLGFQKPRPVPRAQSRKHKEQESWGKVQCWEAGRSQGWDPVPRDMRSLSLRTRNN